MLAPKRRSAWAILKEQEISRGRILTSIILEVMSDIPREAVIVTYCDGETCGLSKELAFSPCCQRL